MDAGRRRRPANASAARAGAAVLSVTLVVAVDFAVRTALRSDASGADLAIAIACCAGILGLLAFVIVRARSRRPDR